MKESGSSTADMDRVYLATQTKVVSDAIGEPAPIGDRMSKASRAIAAAAILTDIFNNPQSSGLVVLGER